MMLASFWAALSGAALAGPFVVIGLAIGVTAARMTDEECGLLLVPATVLVLVQLLLLAAHL